MLNKGEPQWSYIVAPTLAPDGGRTVMSNKGRREAPSNLTTHEPQPVPDAQTMSSAASEPGTNDLRVEMERLRREVDAIRCMSEPPPGYD